MIVVFLSHFTWTLVVLHGEPTDTEQLSHAFPNLQALTIRGHGMPLEVQHIRHIQDSQLYGKMRVRNKLTGMEYWMLKLTMQSMPRTVDALLTVR